MTTAVQELLVEAVWPVPGEAERRGLLTGMKERLGLTKEVSVTPAQEVLWVTANLCLPLAATYPGVRRGKEQEVSMPGPCAQLPCLPIPVCPGDSSSRRCSLCPGDPVRLRLRHRL